MHSSHHMCLQSLIGKYIAAPHFGQDIYQQMLCLHFTAQSSHAAAEHKQTTVLHRHQTEESAHMPSLIFDT